MLIRSIFFCLILSLRCAAQEFPDIHYPQNYFRNPLDVPIKLAANFGELRANHYHMGLDIRTEQRENLPVYAAADGYISRIKIEPFGFGQAIYITHPNGYTTLYAHLNAFAPALAAWVKQQQYQMSSWKVFLLLPPELFPVKKGALIAYSGNMGGSQGPHLHFEIRRTRDDVNVNPMLFGLPIADNKPPVIRRLALYDRSVSIYDQSPVPVAVRTKGTLVSTVQPVIYSRAERVGFGVTAFDSQTGSNNPNGVFQAIVYDNGQPVSGFQMDGISYAETRDINAHIDFKTKSNGGGYYQLLFPVPGYIHSIYRNFVPDGVIDLINGHIHEILIRLRDADGNQSELKTSIQYRPGNTVSIPGEGKRFYPLHADKSEAGDCIFQLGELSLYDSVRIPFVNYTVSRPGVVSQLYTIGKTFVPIRDSITVKLKPNVPLTPEQKSKVLMQWFDTDRTDVKHVQWQGDWASAAFRDFGNFQLVTDEIPPVIGFPGEPEGASLSRASRLLVTATDNFGKLRSMNAWLDGKWLLFTNDKEKAFIYVFDEHCTAGKHSLLVEAVDEAGNKTSRTLNFIR